MAREGNALERAAKDPHGELLEAIADHAEQIYGRLLVVDGIMDPRPRDFVRAGVELMVVRRQNGLAPLARDVILGTFAWLVPVHER